MSTITLSTTIAIIPDKFIGSPIGEESMLMDLDSGNYINLNKIGTIIWNNIEEPTKVSTICEILTQKFEIDRTICETDTVSYLQKLYDGDFIQIQ